MMKQLKSANGFFQKKRGQLKWKVIHIVRLKQVMKANYSKKLRHCALHIVTMYMIFEDQ